MPYLWPKRLQNHTLWGRTYLYSPYKGVPPGTYISQVSQQRLKVVEELKGNAEMPKGSWMGKTGGECISNTDPHACSITYM